MKWIIAAHYIEQSRYTHDEFSLFKETCLMRNTFESVFKRRLFKTACKCVMIGHSPRRLPFRGMAMKDPRLPPMTLCGRRSGGFLKEPVYWCKNECMLWEEGGRPFLTMGSEITTRPPSIHTQNITVIAWIDLYPHRCEAVNTSLKVLLFYMRLRWGQREATAIKGNRQLSRNQWCLDIITHIFHFPSSWVMLGRQHLLCFSLLIKRQANHSKGVAIATFKPIGL